MLPSSAELGSRLYLRPSDQMAKSSSADKYELYSAAFQKPQLEVAGLRALYRQRFGVMPVSLREDFSGTAAIAREWVRSDPRAVGIAIDNDTEPLHWATARLNAEPLSEQSRIRLVHDDVCVARTDRVDVLCALNASFCVLKARSHLVEYLKKCRSALNDTGMLVLNLFAGPDAYRTGRDPIELEDCICIWEQAAFDPSTHRALNHVHFCFNDGSRLNRAFTYDWRLWTLPELADAVTEAGFKNIRIHLGADRSDLFEHLWHSGRAQLSEWWETCLVASR